MSALDAALGYVARGWGVVPLYGVTDDGCRCQDGRLCPPKNRGKHPHGTRRGWRAFTREAEARAWFGEHDHDNLGVITGPESGLFVFDVDGAAGIRSVSELVAEHGPMPATRIVRTGSGGLHYYFRHPGHFVVHNSTSWVAPGVDIRGKGGQVVAPPSRSGLGSYELIADQEVAEAPAWLLAMLAEHAETVERGHRAEVRTAEAVEVELMPERVRNLRQQVAIRDGEGRHRHFYSLVAACFESGYTQGQTVTIVAPWCAAVGKFVGRVEQEVARSWGKLEAEAQRVTDWAGSAPERPVGTTVAQLPASGPTGAPEPTSQASDGESADAVDEIPPSWAPVDISRILAGTYEAEVAELMPRTDDVCLLYPGRVHSFHGESESGKSLVAQAVAAELLKDSQAVSYVDFESDAAAVVGRLRDMGTDDDDFERFTYRRPDTDPRRFPNERAAFLELVGERPSLIVIDGVTDALGVFGYGSNDMDEVSAFMRDFPRYLARRTGAAVVLIDHVTKDADSRGRHAVGSQAKLNSLDGAAYVVEIEEPIGQGMLGALMLRIGKDRPGAIRPHCGEYRKTDRTQPAARIVVDSRGAGIDVTIEAPPEGMASTVGGRRRGRRPCSLMERISDELEKAGPEGLSQARLCAVVGEHKDTVRPALELLQHEGYAAHNGKGGPASRFAHATRYWAHDDEASDTYVGWIGRSDGIGQESDGRPISGMDAQPPRRGASTSVRLTDVSVPDRTDDPDELVSCPSCFRPTTAAACAKYGGRCWACARKAGLL